MEEIQSKIKKIEDSIEKIESEKDDAQTKIKSLEKSLGANDLGKKKRRTFQAQVTSLQARLPSLQARLPSLDAQLAELQRRLGGYEQDLRELKNSSALSPSTPTTNSSPSALQSTSIISPKGPGHQNLQLDWAAHRNEFIQHSIKISNYWMTTTEFSTILKGLNGNRSEFFENGSKIRVSYLSKKKAEETNADSKGWSMVKRNKTGLENVNIYLNPKLKKMLRISKENQANQDYYNIVFLQSACILHEIGHLIIRWQGLEKSPPQIREAGFFIETRLFGGRIAIAFHKENLNNTNVAVRILAEDGKKALVPVDLEFIKATFECVNEKKSTTIEPFPLKLKDLYLDKKTLKKDGIHILKCGDEEEEVSDMESSDSNNETSNLESQTHTPHIHIVRSRKGQKIDDEYIF